MRRLLVYAYLNTSRIMYSAPLLLLNVCCGTHLCVQEVNSALITPNFLRAIARCKRCYPAPACLQDKLIKRWC